MFNQKNQFAELFMIIPKEFREPVAQGIVDISLGIGRWAVGEKKGQIATLAHPIGPTEVVSSFVAATAVAPSATSAIPLITAAAPFITVLATPIAVVGGIATSFYIINKKINAVATSLKRLESKFDDQRWAIVVGAVDQLQRIEHEGNGSPIWADLRGVRQELSEAAAYHWNRIEVGQTTLSAEYAKFDSKAFTHVCKEVLSNLIALAVSRFSLARALLMENVNKAAKQETTQAREEISGVVERISKGFLYYHLKKNAGWIRNSKEYKKIVSFIQNGISQQSAQNTLRTFYEVLKREPAWFDNSLVSDLRESWKEDESNQDVEFLLSLSAETLTREKAYELCEKNKLTPETYVNFVLEHC